MSDKRKRTSQNAYLFGSQYGLFLSLIFILQMAAAITGFTLITQADGIVWGSLNSMMYQGQWGNYERTTMDWIQETVQEILYR